MIMKLNHRIFCCYQQFVEFFNECMVGGVGFACMLLFQSISLNATIMEDWRWVAVIGGWPFMALIDNKSIIDGFVLSILITVLASVPIDIILTAYYCHDISHSSYLKKCQLSAFRRFTRLFLYSFEYTSLPILMIYTISQTLSWTSFSIIFLTVGTLIIVDYHCLQINSTKTEQGQMLRTNYPYKLIDSMLLVTGFIVVGILLDPSFKIQLILAIYLLRFVLSFWLKYYEDTTMRKHRLCLLGNIIICIGVLIAKKSQKNSYVLVLAAAMVVFYFYYQQKIKFGTEWQQLTSQNKIDQLSHMLWKEAKFAQVYHSLVLLSRKDTNFRQCLHIEILKSKCWQFEMRTRDVGMQGVNCETVMVYESEICDLIRWSLKTSDQLLSLLKFVHSKQIYYFIVNVQVTNVMKMVDRCEESIDRILKLHHLSAEALFFSQLLFKKLFFSFQFKLSLESKLRQIPNISQQTQFKKYFYSAETVMIFVNVLDEMSKIVKTSKNLGEVLGYDPRDLIGVSINEIMPFSLREFHEQHLTSFVKSYSKHVAGSPPTVLFYAYNSKFNLERLKLSYSFVMDYFNGFQLCGITRKLTLNYNVILTDQFGNIEGWTYQLGQQFGLNQLGTACNKYNIYPLLPCLVKYGWIDACFKTLFFRIKSMRNPVLKIGVVQDEQERKQKLIEAFHRLIEEEVVDLYKVDIEMSTITLFEGRLTMLEFKFKSYQRVVNMQSIREMILMRENSNLQPITLQKTVKEESFILSEINYQSPLANRLQSAISPNFDADSFIKNEHLKLDTEGQFIPSMLSMSNISQSKLELKSLQPAEKSKIDDQKDEKELKLFEKTNLLPFMIVSTLAYFSILIYDQLSMSSQIKTLDSSCKIILSRNMAFSIFVRASYSTNKTYADYFSLQRLYDPAPYLSQQSYSFSTISGHQIITKSYLFNTRIPTLLKALTSSNHTYTQKYRKQFELNFASIIDQYWLNFGQSFLEWEMNVLSVQKEFYIKIAVMIFGLLIFSILAICMFLQYLNRIQQMQAFFKFDKEDIEKKQLKVKQTGRLIQSYAIKWHLLQQFSDILKDEDFQHLQFLNFPKILDAKLNFDAGKERNDGLLQRLRTIFIIFLSVFLLAMSLYIILFTVMTTSLIQNLRNVFQDVNSCSKLIPFSQLQLASLTHSINSNYTTYITSTAANCLQEPLPTIPQLFSFISQPPCIDCLLLPPLLSHNYRSFFLTFEENILLMKKGDKINKTEMILAADIVTDRLHTFLSKGIVKLKISPEEIILFVVSMILFYLGIYIGVFKMKREGKYIERFIRIFPSSVLSKNKLLDNLFNRNV